MKFFLLLSVVALANASGAEKPTQLPGGGAADLLNNTKFDPNYLPPQDPSKPKIKLNASCKDATGSTSGQGENGFERCVADKQSSAALPGGAAGTKPLPVLTFGNGK